MRKKFISNKKLIIALLLSSCLLQAGWIPFEHKGQNQMPEVRLVASNELSMTFDVQLYGCDAQLIDTKDMFNTNNEVFTLLTISDGYHMGEIGKPKLPVIKKTIGVPHNARIEIEVLRSEYNDVSLPSFGIDNRIMPALESVLKLPGQKPTLAIDEIIYGRDALYPQEIVRIEKVDVMRGHRLAVIEVAPIQYNPVSNMIRYYTDIEIKITFIGGDMAKTKQLVAQDYSSLYEDFIKKRVLNYQFFANITRDVPPLPIHYLIITHNNFQNQINNLAHWLKKKGFKVKVANQDSISPWTSANIENYIDDQVPAPTYLLLVGDVNGGYMPAPIGASSGKVTDLYYAELDGSGYLPDIFYGRLSCETETHITTMVDKILKYQKANMPTGWYKDDAFCAGNDNYTVSEGTHNYCTSTFMDPNGYTTYKLYEQTYGATTQDIFDNVNAGRTLITMSGHGSDDGWHDGPPFTVTHVNQLTNGDRLTIATGHCCLANNFGSSTNPCGGESWIRKENGGAVAYYGSAPSTYWDEDDWLQREWYEAIYADSIFEHARFTLDGMYDGVELSGSGLKRYYYEGYHVLGDPSLDLWTEIPDNMTVTHDAIVFPGASNFTVTVNHGGTPLQNALVCCWIPNQSPQIHVSDYTDVSGFVNLSISPTTPGDTMYVTVTKHNYIPYEGYCLVTSPSGPYIALGSIIINDAGGNGQVNPGETVDLGIWAKNIGVETAYNVYGILSESDPYVTLTTDSSWYGNIQADDSSLSDPYYTFSVANNCPNNYAISFTLEFHDINDSIWTSNPSITVYAPVLTYQDVSVVNDNNGNGILDPGEDADLIVTIENEGGATAENITSTLITSSSYITINDASGNFGTIDPGNTGTNSSDPYNVTADISTPTGTVVNFQVEVVSGVYTDTLEFSLVVGKKHYYIWNPDPTPTPGQNMHTILTNLGYSGDYGISLAADLGLYQIVLVCVGIYSSNYIIDAGSAEAAALVDFLENQDGLMYLEGGDVWYYDPPSGYDFGPLFGIDAISDGTSDLYTVAGQSGTFTEGMSFSYGGENSYIDHLKSTGTGYVIFRNASNTDSCGVANDPGTYKTVGTSFELGLLTDGSPPSTREALLDSIMNFFGITTGIAEDDKGLAGLPMKTMLNALYPNPFRRMTVIRFSIGQGAESIELKIYDAAGRLVKDFSHLALDALRPTQIIWDGTDQNDRKVPAGVYFVDFRAGDYKKTEKAILLR
ncbi:T9SS type A sorting domain-containing protein [candidate division WOR-3 bacterium]|nr:T9SS type A sorting domain-containing protein [candidate division WOR-3 bacterium]